MTPAGTVEVGPEEAGDRIPVRVTRRGLEFTVPRPGIVGGCFSPVLILLVLVAGVILMAGRDAWEQAWEWVAVADLLVGVWWILAAAVMGVVTIAFSRSSNDHYIFGARAVRIQDRLGRIVLGETDLPYAWVGAIDAAEDRTEPGKWWVRFASKRLSRWPALLITPLSRAEAEALAARIREWIAAPEAAESDVEPAEPTPVLVAETALSLLTSRITLVPRLLVGGAALLTLSLLWQLHLGQQGLAPPLPRLDRVAEGEPLHYRWVLHPPSPWEMGSYWTVGLRLAIGYTPEDGEPRTLWLRTRRSRLAWVGDEQQRQVWQTARLFGPPPRQFEVPAWTAIVHHEGWSWPEWRAVIADGHRWDDDYSAASLLSALDDPLHYLAAGWTAAPPDWRVAYSSADPSRAMPLRWAEAEERTLAGVPLRALLPVGGVALLLAFWALPKVVAPRRSRRWLGRLVVLAGILAVPWWSDHAERLAVRLGASDWALDFAADMLRLAAPEEAVDHAFVVRSRLPPRESDGIVLEWAPGASAWAGLLRELGLDAPPPALPLPDSAAATAYMVARARAALDERDDVELIRFADAYDQAGLANLVDTFRDAVVTPALCGLAAAATRDTAVLRRLERTPECAPPAATPPESI
jgi:hypothetical protein